MGACATKPKANANDAPAPLPEKDEVEKKELTAAATLVETKEVAVDTDKSRSLSNLFKESEQVKGTTENYMAQTEMVKEKACEAEENVDTSETKTADLKSEISRETSTLTVIDAVVKADKANEVEAATDIFEILVEKTVIPLGDAPAMVKAKEAIEGETANEETKTLEEKTAAPIALVEDEADKEIEVASATKIQETVAIEDIKIEEHDTVETPKSESVVLESCSDKTEFVEDKTSSLDVYAHFEAETKIEAAANEVQIADAVEEKKIEEHDKVVETQKSESLEEIAKETKQTTELEKPAILPDKEIQESKIQEENTVTENQKALEENPTETGAFAETVKP